MSDITKIEKIHTSAGDHEIDARYWGGNETLKTINGESLFGSGDINIPDEVELIEISGDMLANEPTYTATEALAILEAYYANKLIVLKNSGTTNYSLCWFIPNIFIRTVSTKRQVYISGILANFYIEQRFFCDATSGSVSGVNVDKKIDLTEIGGSSSSSSSYAYGTCSDAAATSTKTVTLSDSYSNFTVSTGSIVAVKFTYTNTVASTSLKLSVAGVTAQIKYLNTTFPSNQHWSAGSVVEFIYDGSAWQVLGNIKDNVGADTKVNQTLTSTNNSYPLLFSYTAGKSSTGADEARFSTGLKYNPSTNALTASTFVGTSTVSSGLKMLTCSTSAATAAKTISLSGFSLSTGSRLLVKFTYANTATSPTLNVNSTGAKSFYYNGNVVSNNNFKINNTDIYELTYNGTYWVISDISSTTDLIYIEQDGDDFAGFSNKMLKFENGTKISIVFSENVGVNAPLLSIIDKNGLYENCYLYYKGEDAKGLFEANKVYTIVLDTSDPDDHKWLLEGDHDIKNYSYVHFNSKNNAGLYSSVPGFLYNGCTVYGIIDTSISTCTANNAHLMSLNDGVYSAEMFKYGESGVAIDGCTTANIPQINRVYLCYYDTDKWFIDIDDSGLEPCKNSQSIMYGTCSSDATASTKVVYVSYNRLNEGDIVWINFTNGNTYTGEQVTMSITTSIGLISTSISTVLDFYNFIGGESGGTSLSGYTAGISMLPGAYEFIYLDSKLKYTGNYVADRAPEILVKSAITGTGAAITFELVKNMHTVFNIGTKPRALVLTIPSASETYSCEFTTGAAPMTFRYPSTLKWVNGILPTLEMSTTYHLSIVNNCAAIVAFKVSETPA